MKRNRVYLIVLIFIIIMLAKFINKASNNVEKRNNEYSDIDYNMLNFESINCEETKINRYDELINIPQVSFLIRNLPIVLDKSVINEQMAIVYCYNYGINFRNDSSQYIVSDSSKNTYVACDYIESVIYELFGRNIELDEYIEQDGYLLISGDNLKTDTIDIEVKDILYNKEYNVYKIIIHEYDNNIEIIYKYKNGKYTLLWCLSEV